MGREEFEETTTKYFKVSEMAPVVLRGVYSIE